jgi:plastocyanin
MLRTTKAAAMLAVLVVVASGCNSRLIRPPAIVYADGGEYSIRTSVDEVGRRFASVFTAFIPSQLPLHPRDALNFDLRDTGEPHTVALGTVIDDAVEAFEALGPTADLVRIERLPAMRRVPSVFPYVTRGRTPRINRSASERCFLDNDEPVVSREGGSAPCPDTDQPDFNGKQTFFSSGILEDGEPFRVKLADDIEPATYRFMCLVHRSAMVGSIEVRSPDVDRPTVAQLREQSDREEESIESSLEPSAKTAATASEGDPIAAGAGPTGLSRGFIAAFVPNATEARVGEPVTWRLYGTHSISFNPDRDAEEGMLLVDDDPITANSDAWEPQGSAALAYGVSVYPPRKLTFEIDGGAWDGEGEWSSGIIPALKPKIVTYTMRFSKAGTYRYSCLVHDSMRGKVVVS